MSQPAYPFEEAGAPQAAYAPEEKGDKKEKKEMLRAKVQSLVARYEEEKNRNEELMMELERLREQQRGAMPANYPPAGMQPGMHTSPPQPGFQPPPGGMQPGMQANAGIQPGFQPPPGGMPPPQRPGMNPQPMNPMGMNPQNPMMGQQFQMAGMQTGMPPQPGAQPYPGVQQQPASPYGQPQQGFGPPPPAQNPMPGFQQAALPGVSPPNYSMQNFGGMPGAMPPPMPSPPQNWPPPPSQQQPSPMNQPGMNAYGAQQGGYQPPFPGSQQAPSMNTASLTQSMAQVMQTIEQVRAKLHQTESIRNGYPQQPAYVDYDTVNLLDKLYDQLGDLSRELMRQRSFA